MRCILKYSDHIETAKTFRILAIPEQQAALQYLEILPIWMYRRKMRTPNGNALARTLIIN